MNRLVRLPGTYESPSPGYPEVHGARWRVDLVALDRSRVLRGWARRELGRRARVDPKTLSTMFNGRRRAELGTVLAVSAAVGLTLAEVIVIDDGATDVTKSAA